MYACVLNCVRAKPKSSPGPLRCLNLSPPVYHPSASSGRHGHHGHLDPTMIPLHQYMPACLLPVRGLREGRSWCSADASVRPTLPLPEWNASDMPTCTCNARKNRVCTCEAREVSEDIASAIKTVRNSQKQGESVASQHMDIKQATNLLSEHGIVLEGGSGWRWHGNGDPELGEVPQQSHAWECGYFLAVHVMCVTRRWPLSHTGGDGAKISAWFLLVLIAANQKGRLLGYTTFEHGSRVVRRCQDGVKEPEQTNDTPDDWSQCVPGDPCFNCVFHSRKSPGRYRRQGAADDQLKNVPLRANKAKVFCRQTQRHTEAQHPPYTQDTRWKLKQQEAALAVARHAEARAARASPRKRGSEEKVDQRKKKKKRGRCKNKSEDTSRDSSPSSRDQTPPTHTPDSLQSSPASQRAQMRPHEIVPLRGEARTDAIVGAACHQLQMLFKKNVPSHVRKVIPPDSAGQASRTVSRADIVQSIYFVLPGMSPVDVDGTVHLVTDQRRPIFIQLALVNGCEPRFLCSNSLCHQGGHVPPFPKKLVEDSSVCLNGIFLKPCICCRILLQYARDSLKATQAGQAQQHSPEASEIIRDLFKHSKPWVKCDESSHGGQLHKEANASESTSNSASSSSTRDSLHKQSQVVLFCPSSPAGDGRVERMAQVGVRIRRAVRCLL